LYHLSTPSGPNAQHKFTSRQFETPTVSAPNKGLLHDLSLSPGFEWLATASAGSRAHTCARDPGLHRHHGGGAGAGLALAQPPLTTSLDQLLDFDFGRLEHQLAVFLGPHPSQEDLRNLTFSFVNVMPQLAGGEPLSSTYLTQNALTALPFGLRNAATVVDHHIAQCMRPLLWTASSLGWRTTTWNRSTTSSRQTLRGSPTLTLAGGASIPRVTSPWRGLRTPRRA
jgi:hypothetical protein